MLILTALVLVTLVAAAVGLARPWELRGGSFVDKLRVARAVSAYDFWLEMRGVRARRRRELRAELRANLWEASLRVGGRQAVTAVRPLRRLAGESAPSSPRPRWRRGLVAAVVALEVVLLVQFFVSSVVVDAAQAAGAARLDVSVTLVPGMRTVYEVLPGGGFRIETGIGPAPLVVAVLVLMVVARPWLLLHRPARATA